MWARLPIDGSGFPTPLWPCLRRTGDNVAMTAELLTSLPNSLDFLSKAAAAQFLAVFSGSLFLYCAFFLLRTQSTSSYSRNILGCKAQYRVRCTLAALATTVMLFPSLLDASHSLSLSPPHHLTTIDGNNDQSNATLAGRTAPWSAMSHSP